MAEKIGDAVDAELAERVSPRERRCGGTNVAGEPCGARVVGQEGFCPAHRPLARMKRLVRTPLGAIALKKWRTGHPVIAIIFGLLWILASVLTLTLTLTIIGVLKEWL